MRPSNFSRRARMPDVSIRKNQLITVACRVTRPSVGLQPRITLVRVRLFNTVDDERDHGRLQRFEFQAGLLLNVRDEVLKRSESQGELVNLFESGLVQYGPVNRFLHFAEQLGEVRHRPEGGEAAD